MNAEQGKAGWSKTGAALFLLFVMVALLADVIAPYGTRERFDPYDPPSRAHLLGTNDVGYDILTELVHGTRVSLLVGFGAAFIATLIGLLIGLVSGYFKGVVDEVLMGVTDIVLMIPRIPLIIILAAFLRPSFWLIGLVIGLLWWTSTARVVRSKVLQVREMDYVTSARCLGFSRRHILFSDILPNIMQVVLPKFMLTIAAAMISEASLSFLGLGDAGMKSWGMMLNFAFQKGALVNGMWWWFLSPGLCITLVVAAVVLMGISQEEQGESGAMVSGG
jgi:peptide/nickel transport system permease protein